MTPYEQGYEDTLVKLGKARWAKELDQGNLSMKEFRKIEKAKLFDRRLRGLTEDPLKRFHKNYVLGDPHPSAQRADRLMYGGNTRVSPQEVLRRNLGVSRSSGMGSGDPSQWKEYAQREKEIMDAAKAQRSGKLHVDKLKLDTLKLDKLPIEMKKPEGMLKMLGKHKRALGVGGGLAAALGLGGFGLYSALKDDE
jgi:hypothetical protein